MILDFDDFDGANVSLTGPKFLHLMLCVMFGNVGLNISLVHRWGGMNLRLVIGTKGRLHGR